MHQNRHIYTLPEYKKKLRNNYKKLGLYLQNESDNKIFIFRPIPNCPWLPESRKKYFKKLRNKLESLPTSSKYTFATLTYSARTYSPASACRTVKHDIDLFFKRLGYHHRKVQFFYVIELTDNMLPHIHIIFDQFIPWKKLRHTWFKVTGNTVTNIKHLPQKQAFWYCLKYLTDAKKQSETKWSFLFKHIDRIWTCSRGFLCASESSTGKFKFLFSLWDPNYVTGSDFSDQSKDLMSNEVNINDAICIAGFTNKFKGCRILNAVPEWLFFSQKLIDQENVKSISLTPVAFQIMFNFYQGV